MRDTMDILEMAVYNALNGQLSYNSVNIPVYDEKRRVGQSDNIYVILSTQQESEIETNDCAFVTLSSIDIEILHKTDYEVSKTVINNISNQILQILIPTQVTTGLAGVSGYQLLHVRRERAITRNFQITDSESIIAKIITITCQIVKQNA